LQGARIAGAAEIIAIDMRPSKLAVAGELGATAKVDARTQDPVSIVRELTGRRGADVTIEAVGAQMAVDQAIRMTGHGGEVVFVGIGTPGVRIDLPQLTGLVLPAKTLKGCLFGSVDLQRDVPRLIDHYRAGEFQLDRLISETFALEQINDAFGALSSGELVSAVIELP
jgi:Zn-dependent alcohol dehydrogenase